MKASSLKISFMGLENIQEKMELMKEGGIKVQRMVLQNKY